MFDYESGVFLALVIWVFTMLRVVVMVNSQLQKNLNRIGLELSWLSFEPKPIEGKPRTKLGSAMKFVLLLTISFPSIFLSWGHVFFFVATTYFMWEKRSDKPEAIKEFHWRMKNVDMSFDDIIRAQMRSVHMDPSMFEEVRDQKLHMMEGNALK